MKCTEVQDCVITLVVAADVHVAEKTATKMDKVPEGAKADVPTKTVEVGAVGQDPTSNVQGQRVQTRQKAMDEENKK